MFFPRVKNKQVAKRGCLGVSLNFFQEVSIVVLTDIAILLTPGVRKKIAPNSNVKNDIGPSASKLAHFKSSINHTDKFIF